MNTTHETQYYLSEADKAHIKKAAYLAGIDKGDAVAVAQRLAEALSWVNNLPTNNSEQTSESNLK